MPDITVKRFSFRVRRWVVYANLFLCSVLVPVSAQGQTVSGVGSRECSVFLFAIEKGSDVAIDSFLSWAQGWLSGYNATNEHHRNISIDHAGLFDWLSSYCTANKKALFAEAVASLTRS